MERAGDKIRLVNDSTDISNWGSGESARDKLIMRGVYEVEDVRVHSWHTKLKLKGIDGWFNSAHFEKVKETEDKLDA